MLYVIIILVAMKDNGQQKKPSNKYSSINAILPVST